MKEYEFILNWLAYNYPGVYRQYKDHIDNQERISFRSIKK